MTKKSPDLAQGLVKIVAWCLVKIWVKFWVKILIKQDNRNNSIHCNTKGARARNDGRLATADKGWLAGRADRCRSMLIRWLAVGWPVLDWPTTGWPVRVLDVGWP